MLEEDDIQQIQEFVYQEPRTVNDVAELLDVHWKTADKYVKTIAEEKGTIGVKTFRGGTRGALKVVYWATPEEMHASQVQERLFTRVEAGRDLGDFSPSELYQFVDADKKKLRVLTEEEYASTENFKDFANLLRSASNRIFFFSGNLTFSQYKMKRTELLDVLEEVARDGVDLYVVTRVELPGIENIQRVLAVNNRVGRDAVHIRHSFQPLRCTIVDSEVAVLKEFWRPEDYYPGELEEKRYGLYYVYAEQWIDWLQKVFWHLYRNAVDADTRLQDLAPHTTSKDLNE